MTTANLPDYYDTLDISRSASQSEVIQAYRLAMETFDANSEATYSMFDEQELSDIRTEIEQAYRTLAHSEKRKAYDALLLQNSGSGLGSSQNRNQPEKNVFYLNQSSREREGNQTLFTGQQLKSMRKSRGVTLMRMSANTGISERILQAIEEQDASKLGELSNLKQILTRYATEVGADPAVVSNSYPLL